MEKRGAITPPQTLKKKKGKLTLYFEGITPTERLYGNTCQGDDLFPFTSSDSAALIRLCTGLRLRFRRSERQRSHTI